MNQKTIAPKVLRWYDKSARRLPFRYKQGQRPNLYYVWLSEMMLQQTQVVTVIPYFKKFTQNWRTLEALANARAESVVAAWAGLGYYARARALHKTARILVKEHKGKFPKTASELKALAGIGEYTASAIMAFGHREFAVVVDGNIKRVLSRVFAVRFDDDEKIKEEAARATPAKRSGDYAQALMDLGSGVCLTQAPLCDKCPLIKNCQAYQKNKIALYGRRSKVPPKAHRKGKVYIISNKDRGVLLIRRPSKGLLGGLLAFPSASWDGSSDAAPLKIKWQKHQGVVRHVFTHFTLALTLYSASVNKKQADKLKGLWRKRINTSQLPSLMRKVWVLYLSFKD